MSRFIAPVGVVLLMGAVASSAWAQPAPIDIPIGTGGFLTTTQASALFVQPVFTTTDVDLRLQAFVNGVCKYNVCRRVLTSGPAILVLTRVPVGTFGLKAGDNVAFKLTVDHVGVTAGKRSTVQYVLPVIPALQEPPPTTETRRPDGVFRVFRRETVGIENA